MPNKANHEMSISKACHVEADVIDIVTGSLCHKFEAEKAKFASKYF